MQTLTMTQVHCIVSTPASSSTPSYSLASDIYNSHKSWVKCSPKPLSQCFLFFSASLSCFHVISLSNSCFISPPVQIDIQFSQAKFDMSSFIGGIILVLCVQAGGFFAMRFLKAKEQSTYDPMWVCACRCERTKNLEWLYQFNHVSACHCVKQWSVGATGTSSGRSDHQHPLYKRLTFNMPLHCVVINAHKPHLPISKSCLSSHREQPQWGRNVWRTKRRGRRRAEQWLIELWRQEFFVFFEPLSSLVWSPCVPLGDGRVN